MNELEESILAALEKKIAGAVELNADFGALANLIGKEKQTAEDWTRLAELSVAVPREPPSQREPQ